jgi:hypothetical protein
MDLQVSPYLTVKVPLSFPTNNERMACPDERSDRGDLGEIPQGKNYLKVYKVSP